MLHFRKIKLSVTGVALISAVSAISGCSSSVDLYKPRSISIAAGNFQAVAAGATVANPLVVRVTNQFGEPSPGVTLTWAIAAGGGTLATATTTSDADGLSSNTYTAGTTTGTSRITATLAGLGTVTFLIDVT